MTRLEVRVNDETVWLTQAQMAELFQTTPQNVTIHIKNIYKEGEGSPAVTLMTVKNADRHETRTPLQGAQIATLSHNGRPKPPS